MAAEEVLEGSDHHKVCAVSEKVLGRSALADAGLQKVLGCSVLAEMGLQLGSSVSA